MFEFLLNTCPPTMTNTECTVHECSFPLALKNAKSKLYLQVWVEMEFRLYPSSQWKFMCPQAIITYSCSASLCWGILQLSIHNFIFIHVCQAFYCSAIVFINSKVDMFIYTSAGSEPKSPGISVFLQLTPSNLL